jgi:hypothetical protein
VRGRRLARLLAATACFPLVLIPLGCFADGPSEAGRAELLGFGTYFVKGDAFEGTTVARLDPETLRPLAGHQLALGDHTGTGILSPDGRTLALGGTNYSELLLVDLRRLRRVGVVKVPGRKDYEVAAVSWPRPDRLIATATDTTGKELLGNKLVVVDPATRRVVRSADPHGAIVDKGRMRGGVFLLVTPLKGIGPARLLVVTPTRIRELALSRIRTGTRGPISLGQDAYFESRSATVIADGRGNRAFVIAAQAPIAEVNLRSLRVRYHRLPGLSVPHLPPAPLRWSGTSGPLLVRNRSAVWLRRGLVAVGGYDSFPVRTRSSRWLSQRDVTRTIQLVDTRAWRIVRTLRRATACRAVHELLVCSEHVGRSTAPKLEKSVLVMYRRDGTVLYRAARSNLWWDIQAGRLFTGHPDGSHIWELDPETGRKIRDFGSTHNWATWPSELRRWVPPA